MDKQDCIDLLEESGYTKVRGSEFIWVLDEQAACLQEYRDNEWDILWEPRLRLEDL